MAFVTSYVIPEKGAVRVRACVCYHGSVPTSDDPDKSHAVLYTFGPDEPFFNVYDLWALHGWVTRGKLPICPRHREACDQEMLLEEHPEKV